MKAFLIVLGLLAGALAFGQEAADHPLPPALEARAERIGKQLRCAVCQGMSVTDSPSSMAKAQLNHVREMVAQGKSDEEIRQYFIARYGTWILLNPPAEGFAWLVWLLPVALVIGGGFVIAKVVKQKPPAAGAPPTTTPTPDAPPSDPYLAKVRAELDQ
jgi:cytochrome c-type biogenesis protein CcmH